MWKKYKWIFNEPAQLPTVEDRDDCMRIFYSYRLAGKSYINYFEINNELNVIYRNSVSVFEPGERGCFDDCGVMPSCLIKHANRTFLYYTGWNTDKGGVPYGHGIGVATWNEDLNKFTRIYSGPILDRSIDSPYLVNSPFVMMQNGSFKMWYCNGTGWEDTFPKYDIQLITSDTMIFENKSFSKIIVGEENEACSRPFVKDGNLFFSKKTRYTPYEIYSLEKKELMPDTGPDSEMVCYPYICRDYMFYNGNNYGETGIGVAKCIEN